MTLPTVPIVLLAGATLIAAAPAPVKAEESASSPVVQAPTLYVPGERLSGAAAALTRVELEALPAATNSFERLAGETANLSLANGGAGGFGDVVTLRGMGNTPFFGAPAVTVYLDDLPLSRAFMFPVELLGAESAELCRSPASNARYGLAGSAGVLRLVSAMSSGATAPHGEVRASFGNFGARRLLASVFVPGAHDFNLTLNAAAAERDGYLRNTTLGTRVDDRESLAAHARARWRATDELEVALQLAGSRTRDGAQPLVPLGGPLFTVDRDREGETGIDAFNAAFTLTHRAPQGQFTATTSFTDWELDPYSNRLVLPPALDSRVTQRQRGWSEELRYARDLAAHVALNAGAFWRDEKIAGTVDRELVGLFPIEQSAYTTQQQTLAAFGEVAFRLNDAWTLTPGARLARASTSFEREETIPVPGAFRASHRDGVFLPQLAATYAVSSRTSATVSLGANWKPGGFSAFTSNPDLAAFRPERSRVAEVAVQHRSRDDVWSMTARLFWYEIDNYQIERSFTQTDYLVVNAARARSRGGELELAWRPRTHWRVTAQAGVTAVELREFTDPFTQENYAGNRAPYAPEFDAHLRVDYAPPEGWFGGVTVGAVGRTFYDEAESELFAQGSYVLLGARVGYASTEWRVTLFGENLADEEFYSSITPGVFHGTPGAPRVYGMEASWRF